MESNEGKGKIARLQEWMKRVPDWILSIVCLGVILWLTLSPDPLGDVDTQWFEGVDKVVHGIMFFGLTLCFLIDAKRARGWQRLKLPAIGAFTLLGMLIGMGIEFLQPAFGRGFEFWDMGADAFGAVLAGTIWTFVDGILTMDDNYKARHE